MRFGSEFRMAQSGGVAEGCSALVALGWTAVGLLQGRSHFCRRRHAQQGMQRRFATNRLVANWSLHNSRPVEHRLVADAHAMNENRLSCCFFCLFLFCVDSRIVGVGTHNCRCHIVQFCAKRRCIKQLSSNC